MRRRLQSWRHGHAGRPSRRAPGRQGSGAGEGCAAAGIRPTATGPARACTHHRVNGHRSHVAIGGRVLVLNASYEPINVCNVRRATVLLLKERAEVIERGEGALHSERLTFDRPCVIRLIRYIRIPRDVHRRKITRKAVLARDAWTCQYCGHQAHGTDRRPRDPAQPGRGVGVGEHRRLVRPVQPQEGQPDATRGADAPSQPPAARRARPSSSASPARGSRAPGSHTCSPPSARRAARRAAPRGGPSSRCGW